MSGKIGKIEAKYRARTKRSAELTERAERVMPGGETRSGVYHAPYSVLLERGEGARCFDVDGNEYLDLANNYTVLVHGHAFPPIVEAVQRQVEKGSTWAAKSMGQIELAELLVDRVASVDQVRFTNSGTEAVLAAIAVARAHTGRQKVLLAEYAYHGHLLETGSRDAQATSAFNSSPGAWLPHHLATFGDAESFEAVLAEHGDEIAAVMLEPILGLGGVISAPREFFVRVQEAAHAAGALLVFDEATVHRVATGGAQQGLDIRPDLSVLGKFVGGGHPVGTVGGSREVMSVLDPRTGNCHLSGSFSGNPVTMAAGIAAVGHFTEEAVAGQTRQMAQIESELQASAARHGLPFSTRRIGSLMNLYFSETPPVVNQLRDDNDLAEKFQLACLANGVFIVSRIVINFATTATDKDTVEVCERLDQALADVAAEV